MQGSPALAIFCDVKRGGPRCVRGCEIAERQGETSGVWPIAGRIARGEFALRGNHDQSRCAILGFMFCVCGEYAALLLFSARIAGGASGMRSLAVSVRGWRWILYVSRPTEQADKAGAIYLCSALR